VSKTTIWTNHGQFSGLSVETIVRRVYGRRAFVRWNPDPNGASGGQAGLIVHEGPGVGELTADAKLKSYEGRWGVVTEDSEAAPYATYGEAVAEVISAIAAGPRGPGDGSELDVRLAYDIAAIGVEVIGGLGAGFGLLVGGDAFWHIVARHAIAAQWRLSWDPWLSRADSDRNASGYGLTLERWSPGDRDRGWRHSGWEWCDYTHVAFQMYDDLDKFAETLRDPSDPRSFSMAEAAMLAEHDLTHDQVEVIRDR
jgi:hypothetical protein